MGQYLKVFCSFPVTVLTYRLPYRWWFMVLQGQSVICWNKKVETGRLDQYAPALPSARWWDVIFLLSVSRLRLLSSRSINPLAWISHAALVRVFKKLQSGIFSLDKFRRKNTKVSVKFILGKSDVFLWSTAVTYIRKLCFSLRQGCGNLRALYLLIQLIDHFFPQQFSV